jgi:hypothetical protein
MGGVVDSTSVIEFSGVEPENKDIVCVIDAKIDGPTADDDMCKEVLDKLNFGMDLARRRWFVLYILCAGSTCTTFEE